MAHENQWLLQLFFFQAEHFDILLAWFSVLSFLIQPGYAMRPIMFFIRRHRIWEVSENKTEPNQTEPNLT